MTAWVKWLKGVLNVAPTALISVLATEGSAPRGAGTRMVVSPQRQWGTIGGGELEFRATMQAKAILSLPRGSWRVQDYPLGPLLGQCCGGRVRLLIEHVDPAGMGWLEDTRDGGILVSSFRATHINRHVADGIPCALPSARGERPAEGTRLAERLGDDRKPLYLFGAGHVGQAIAYHARRLPFHLAWFDTRPEFDMVDGAVFVAESDIEQCVKLAPRGAAIVILTHDHGLDYRLTRTALGQDGLAFVGLIGSATKRARFLSRLDRDGVVADTIRRLTCPIGAAGIAGKEPDVIAIALLAQLLQLRTAEQPATAAQAGIAPRRTVSAEG